MIAYANASTATATIFQLSAPMLPLQIALGFDDGDGALSSNESFVHCQRNYGCSSARAGVIAAYSTAFGISCVALAFWLKSHGHAAA